MVLCILAMCSWEKPVKGSNVKKGGLLKRLLNSGSSHSKKEISSPSQQQQQQLALQHVHSNSTDTTGAVVDDSTLGASSVVENAYAVDATAIGVHAQPSGAVAAMHITIEDDPIVSNNDNNDIAIPVAYVSPANRLRLHDLQEQISPSGE
jgi:hypothetical protein